MGPAVDGWTVELLAAYNIQKYQSMEVKLYSIAYPFLVDSIHPREQTTQSSEDTSSCLIWSTTAWGYGYSLSLYVRVASRSLTRAPGGDMDIARKTLSAFFDLHWPNWPLWHVTIVLWQQGDPNRWVIQNDKRKGHNLVKCICTSENGLWNI